MGDGDDGSLFRHPAVGEGAAGNRARAPDYNRAMKKLPLSFACWDYDRTRGLADGTVRPDGIDLTYLSLPVEETFFRMMRNREFDASEMSLSSYTASLGSPNRASLPIPAFPS